MADRLHLSRKHRRILEALLREHLPDVEVWVYGSRVSGRSHEGSDLDLVLRGPGLREIPVEQLAELRDALCESTIPFLVEARDWARLPERFHQEIEQDHMVLTDPVLHETKFAALLAEPVRNGIYKAKQLHGRGVKMINMGELFAHPRLRDVPMNRVDLNESEQARFCVEQGDLLFARRSLVAEGAGKCCVVLEAPEATAFESSIIRARPDSEQADSLFLYYYFNSPMGLHGLDTIRRQVAVAGITGSDLANLRVRLPRLGEQRAIAYILGALDDKIERNRRENETLEAMARALFKSWFVDFEPVRAKAEWANVRLPHDVCQLFPDSYDDSALGNVPSGWKVVELTDLIEVNPKRPSLRKGESAPYVPMSSMPTSGHTPSQVSARPFSSGMRFVNGDTLLARITPCLENGKTAYVDFLKQGQIGWGSTEYIVLRPKPCLPSEFAYCLARSLEFRDFAIQSMTGTSGRQRVQPTALGQFLLAHPPERIAREFGRLVRPLIERARMSADESQSLAELRDTLLPGLISGELRIPDAELIAAAVT